ncbi:chorismate-binding protein [Blattabacterium cuenoti]|uniref:chorismate-binding protein n=1 Tax=Blattabacterium cuenoti TaxID=1653831 RepID=UPI00163B73D4|nr:chorismate-binding protein [Blattabacterium cuenoti]
MKKISVISMYKKIIQNYKDRNKFVIFRKPNENKIFIYFNCNYCNNESFFLIKSFDNNKTIKIFPKKIYYVEINKNNINNYYNKNNLFIKNFLKKNFSYEYKNLIKLAIKKIENSIIKKIVVSNNVKIPMKYEKINLKKTFEKLLIFYPNTLISLWYDSKYGFWIGCTPELLIKYQNNILKTTALAGTIWGNKKWTKKEITEHKIVIDYIINSLKCYKKYLYIDKTESLDIGNLKHLKTNIYIYNYKNFNYFNILEKLYPTPSICGYPKYESMNFIKKYEKHNRNFYSGYMGLIDKDYIELYVNLRCAEINKKKIILYAGSGIIINSKIYQEYLETYKKIESIISNIIIY